MSTLSEPHMCLLRDYRTAWQITKQLESLNIEIVKMIDSFWEEKTMKVLGNECLLGDSLTENPNTLTEHYCLTASKKSWIHSSSENEQSLLVQMFFSMSEQHENKNVMEDWLVFFLELIPDNRMGIYYDFSGFVDVISDKIGRKGKFAKDDVIKRMGSLVSEFESHGYSLVRSTKLCFDKPIVLSDLLTGLENEDLDLAFAPILAEIERFAIFAPHIDRLIQELT